MKKLLSLKNNLVKADLSNVRDGGLVYTLVSGIDEASVVKKIKERKFYF